MKRYKQRTAPVRWGATLAMLAVSVALWGLSVGGYAVLRRPYLQAADTAVVMAGARELTVDETLMARHRVVSAAESLDEEGQLTGYVVVAETTGYKSTIRLQATFTADARRLAAVKVLSHNETEYLGDRIVTPAFTQGFAGRLAPVKLTGSAAMGSPVDGLSGSTVSAAAVMAGVNAAHAFLLDYLAG